ncbi:MAG: hypothetical protein QFB87_04355 [Patescibacteria group bacterium]|nr:hypothetical protein [Patescibacteria group bacterium]
MESTLKQLKLAYPGLSFKPAHQFCWSPENHEISYKRSATGDAAIWSLLHETGHALLDHSSYQADFQLVRLEVAAWDKAKAVAATIGVTIDENHIQDCLDTYRDWLYKRSICPTCRTKCLQQNDFVHYRCFNCHTTWRVTPSRFCRAYRSTKNIQQPATFHLAK